MKVYNVSNGGKNVILEGGRGGSLVDECCSTSLHI